MMIEPNHDKLAVSRQLELVNLNSSSYYYKSEKQPESPLDKELKSEIQELYSIQPAGYRMMHGRLQLKGYNVGESVIRRLMAELGLHGPYPKPNLSKRNHEHKIYPYLLRGLDIDHANHVWATDITYIKLAKGTAYLLAIIDLYSRKILAWRISNTQTVDFCIEALNEALELYDPPEIFNTDQGSQFTSDEFTGVLLDRDVKISMDGKGRALDNVFIERFWRTIKYDYLHRHDFQTMPELIDGVSWFIDYYNRERPHSSLNKRTPEAVYYDCLWNQFTKSG